MKASNIEAAGLLKCSVYIQPGPGALGRPRGTGRRGRWEGVSGWGIHVNPWLIHVNVWQNPLQYCKVISLQLIKKIKQNVVYSSVCSVLSDFFVTPWTIARQAPLSMGFPRQESWSGLPWPLSGNLPNQGMELASLNIYLHWWTDSLSLAPPGKPYPTYKVLVTQSCPTLCDAMDCSPPGSFVHGIL